MKKLGFCIINIVVVIAYGFTRPAFPSSVQGPSKGRRGRDAAGGLREEIFHDAVEVRKSISSLNGEASRSDTDARPELGTTNGDGRSSAAAAVKPQKDSTDDETSSTSSFFVKDTSPSSIITEVYVAEVESLRDRFPSYENESSDDGTTGEEAAGTTFTSSRIEFERMRASRCRPIDVVDIPTHVANIKYNQLISDDEIVLVDILRGKKPDGGGGGGDGIANNEPSASSSRAFRRAGPRKYLHFNPEEVNAAIVVAGGLCPGLNNVIRELVHALYYLYGANKVYGITGGFNGFHDPRYEPVLLTNELVAEIHHEGGSVLRSARGGLDVDKTIQFLERRDISQLYVIGGDGSHRGANAINNACVERNLNVAVAGIPKTIDNDIDYIDRSFGVVSAVEAAQAGIRTAATEAKCNAPNGIGIAKLMGRSAGFLASFAALGSGEVDLVLVPEIPIVLDGEDGILPFIRTRLKEQNYAVIVVAEGAGEELLGVSNALDAGGNRARPKIGEFIREAIPKYLAKFGEQTTIKYIDPSYLVRSVPANAVDALYCMQLAQNAVHGAMAGLTGFSTGMVNKNLAYIPIPLLTATSPRSMNPFGGTWERIIAMTGQPNHARSPPPEKADEDETFPRLPEPEAH